MSPDARTVAIFGVYVIAVGATVALLPGVVLAVLGLPPTQEPWFRLVGWLALVIGVYYLAGARAEATPFLRASVPLRFASAVVFVGIAVSWGYPTVALFALPDLAGALWTWTALRRPAPAT